MNDEEFHARIKELYHPPKNQFSLIDVPDIRYMMIDGQGDPKDTGIDTAIQWLWSVVHFLMPIAKQHMGKNFAYPPLECLFWADNTEDFVLGNKNEWNWRVMVVLATWMTKDIFELAVVQAEEKRGEKAPKTLRIDHLQEGKSVQFMHVGDYDKTRGICEKLYTEHLPEYGLKPNGYYHEIYLNDPNRTAPEKRKTVIRQPVK